MLLIQTVFCSPNWEINTSWILLKNPLNRFKVGNRKRKTIHQNYPIFCALETKPSKGLVTNLSKTGEGAIWRCDGNLSPLLGNWICYGSLKMHWPSHHQEYQWYCYTNYATLIAYLIFTASRYSKWLWGNKLLDKLLPSSSLYVKK